MILLSPDATHVDLKLSRAVRDERHGLVRQWWNLKLLGIPIVHVVAQQERTPTKLRTAHLDRAGKVLVEVTTLDHDIPPDRVESQQALRSERSTKPKPHRPREQQAESIRSANCPAERPQRGERSRQLHVRRVKTPETTVIRLGPLTIAPLRTVLETRRLPVPWSLRWRNLMTRILFVGQKPETVDFSDPSLPPGFDAEKINAGI